MEREDAKFEYQLGRMALMFVAIPFAFWFALEAMTKKQASIFGVELYGLAAKFLVWQLRWRA